MDLSDKKILDLTIKKEWFLMILNGIKPEEYREIKPFWETRLMKKGSSIEFESFDVIRFRNGYSRNCPSLLIECLGISVGFGNTNWGALPGKEYFIIRLGKVIESKNYFHLL